MEVVAKKDAKLLIELVKFYINDWVSNGWQNSQWFIDFEDELNRISVEDRRIIGHKYS